MKKKIVKVELNEKEWNEEAGQVARDFCPPIYPCAKCGHPVVNGYCCTFCGEVDPD